MMLAITSNTRFFFYQHAVSMHKGFEGLSTIIEEVFLKELFTGAFFIFLNRKKDHMKILCWDSDGLAIWYKRLERGAFTSKNISENKMTRKEFLMLLEGITPKKIQARFSL